MRQLLAVIVWLAFAGAAGATTYQVDLNSLTPSGSIFGPCYCGSGSYYSFSAQPGDTVDFGQVQSFWQIGAAGLSTGTPGQVGYPDTLYFLAEPVIGYNSPITAPDVYSAYQFTLCVPGDAACAPGPVTFTLSYSLPVGDSSIQIGLYGPFNYMAPAVPEPSTWAMLLIGFAGIGLMSHRYRAIARAYQTVQFLLGQLSRAAGVCFGGGWICAK